MNAEEDVKKYIESLNNGDFETAVGSAEHGGAVAGQSRADEQASAADGRLRITRTIARHIGPGVVVAAEIGKGIAGCRADCVDVDRDGLSRGRLDGQAGRSLRAALDAVGRVGHAAVGRDSHALEIGHVPIERPELQGLDLADRDGFDEGHLDLDGRGARDYKTGRQQQPHGGDGHAQFVRYWSGRMS